MQSKFKEYIQDWAKEMVKLREEKQYHLLMTSDIDSHFSHALIRFLCEYKVAYFYDFYGLYIADWVDESKIKLSDIIGVDVALDWKDENGEGMKTICNHLTAFQKSDYNKNSVNINNYLGITRNNYHEKYAMSTVNLVCALFGLWASHKKQNREMIKLEQSKTFWTIDASKKCYFSDQFNPIANKYIEILELEPTMRALQEDNASELLDGFTREHKMYGHIWVNANGKLETDIKIDKLQKYFPKLDLSLPEYKFKKIVDFNYHKRAVYGTHSKEEYDNLFSFALTYKSEARFSTIKKSDSQLFKLPPQ